ncbi:hypothetical protein PSPO01_00872 [Paraphaeosphaeria sporulosa]
MQSILGVLVLATGAPRRASRIPKQRHYPRGTDNTPDLACCTPRSLPCQAAGRPCSLGNTSMMRVARGAPPSGLGLHGGCTRHTWALCRVHWTMPLALLEASFGPTS